MEQNFWNISGKTNYPQLEEDTSCDIAIIGGGLAGVMCAHVLKDLNMSISIFEANIICGGESANSSAMITFAHDLIYRKLVKKHGNKTAESYFAQNKSAQEYIEELSKEVECDYRHCDLIYFATTQKGAKNLEQEKGIYKSFNQNYDSALLCELPFPVASTMRIPSQGCLNPYMFISNLCENLKKSDVKIYEHSRAIDNIKDNEVTINNHKVKAKYFIIATHYPYINIPGYYFTKMYQSRSHSCVYNTNIRLSNMYESAEENGFEYRPTNKGTLCGGCGVRTGRYKNQNYYNIIDCHMKEKFMTTESDKVAQFSAQDCITLDELPFIGKYSKSDDNIFVVTGFNKWGFTSSVVAAQTIKSLIKGENKENIFEPHRLYAIKSPIKEIKNIACDIAGFGSKLTTDVQSVAEVQVGEGKIVKINGERLGVYRREDGGIDAIKATCPHIGCALKWNNTEKTWDCPCHGSRFDTKGNILSSPTVKNAEKRKV